MKIKITDIANKFRCLQADCPDTCCKGWSMQLDDKTFERYKGTALEDAVAYDGQNNEIRVMRRDAETDFCVKFENGICAIHRDMGEQYLGDACNFYPRVTRKFDDELVMTAVLSCPEIVNLSLFGENGGVIEKEVERLPDSLRSYKGSFVVHQAFMDVCESEKTAPEILANIYSTARSLSSQEQEEWPSAAPFFLKIADGMLPEPEFVPEAEQKILHIFAGVFYSTGKKMNPRLAEVLADIENYVSAKVDWQMLDLLPHDDAGHEMEPRSIDDGLLKKYLAAQLSFSTFPYAGIGEDIIQRALVLVYRFALIRLALSASRDDSQEGIVKTVQAISRVVDHVGDATLLLQLMDSFGWNSDAKIAGLIRL